MLPGLRVQPTLLDRARKTLGRGDAVEFEGDHHVVHPNHVSSCFKYANELGTTLGKPKNLLFHRRYLAKSAN